MSGMDAGLGLERALTELLPSWTGRGWQAVGPPSNVLAMTRPLAAGVEHTLFVTGRELPGDASAVALGCTVNVHYPALEACILEALERDPTEAGRQSLRLPLARVLPGDHPAADGYRLRAGSAAPSSSYPSSPPSATSSPCADTLRALDALLGDYDRFLEPVRRPLERLDALAQAAFVPPAVDPWVWHLRRAAYFHLHAGAAARDDVFALIEAQAERALARLGADPAGTDDGLPTASPDALAIARGATEALELVRRLRRPRRRVVGIGVAPR